jgi:hypothetical protein
VSFLLNLYWSSQLFLWNLYSSDEESSLCNLLICDSERSFCWLSKSFSFAENNPSIPADLENSVKRIIGEEIKKSQNDLLTQMDGLFSAKLKNFDNQQKECSRLRTISGEDNKFAFYFVPRKLMIITKRAKTIMIVH